MSSPCPSLTPPAEYSGLLLYQTCFYLTLCEKTQYLSEFQGQRAIIGYSYVGFVGDVYDVVMCLASGYLIMLLFVKVMVTTTYYVDFYFHVLSLPFCIQAK